MSLLKHEVFVMLKMIIIRKNKKYFLNTAWWISNYLGSNSHSVRIMQGTILFLAAVNV